MINFIFPLFEGIFFIGQTGAEAVERSSCNGIDREVQDYSAGQTFCTIFLLLFFLI